MIDENAVRRIEDLHKLMEAGVITAEDFEKAKQDLLFRPKQRSFTPLSPSTTKPDPDNEAAWAILPLQRYADFEGRSCRQEFWAYFMMQFLIVMVSFALMGLSFIDSPFFSAIWMTLLVLAVAATIVPNIAVQVRRFHDQDKSGWFVLLNLIPYLGWIIVLIFMMLEGTKGDNRFGPDPLEDQA